jgi:hypothetical protein
MPSRQFLAALVVASVVLAGCGGATTNTATTETTTTTGTSAATTTSTAETTTATTATETNATTGTTTLEEVDADAETVAADVVAAMEATDQYRLAATIERTQTANGVTRSATVESDGVFDRDARRLRVTQTTSGSGGSVTVDTYLVEDTLYQHSPAFVRTYSSEWVKQPLENDSARWRTLDTLSRQRFVITNASVTVQGATTVEGTEAYVLALDVDEAAYDRVLERRLEDATTNVSVSVEEATFEYVVAADSGRLLSSTGTIESSVTGGGQSVSLSEEVELSFSGYGEAVSVSLPDAADAAVNLDNRTAA